MKTYQVLKGFLLIFVFIFAFQVNFFQDMISLTPKTAAADNAIPCALCQWVLQETDKYLTSESSTEEIEVSIRKVCSYLPPILQPKCQMMVEQNRKDIAYLIQLKVPDMEICQALPVGEPAMCPGGEPGYVTIPCSSLSCTLYVPTGTQAKAVQPSVKRLAQASPAETPAPLIFKTRYFVLYEGERPLLAIDTSDLTVRVIEGVLRYGGSYEFFVLDASTTNELMDMFGPIAFNTPVKPEDEDEYGNPLITQGLRDERGKSIPLADTKLNTLIVAGAGLLSQQDMLTAIQGAGGAMKDLNGATLAQMNNDNVRVARSQGGEGKEIVFAASNANLMAKIKPLTATGYAMDKDGNMSPDVTLAPSGVSLPLGLFDFSVSIANNTNSTEVVIIPPAPLALGTKWYKVASDGTLAEYPNFKVDALGNGILTLYDNDEYDKNPAFGIIRDPGGPGVPVGGGGGCFIATAAYGSYLHPFVKVLRAFRDKVLLVSPPGRSFVKWYYSVSPPIADVIARHNALKAAVRIALLPAIGLAWLCLKVGVLPMALLFLAFCAIVAILMRSCRSSLSHPTP